jgi:DNA (cytosine-5)-methyltransferase 1
MVAWRDDYRKSLASLFEHVRGVKVGRERTGFMTPNVHDETGAIVPEIAYCVAATSGRHTGNDWARSYISYDDRVRRPTPTESERLQGFPAGWTIPANGYRALPRGLDSERYRAIGNSVAVPVVRWIAERIAKALAQPNGSRGPRNFKLEALQLAPDLRKHTEVLRFDSIMDYVENGKFVYRWKGCGVAWGNEIMEGATAPAPSKIVSARFVDILDPEIPDDRYFLTPNAAIGMLRRADTVGRIFFPPMRAALEKLVTTTNLATTTPEHMVKGVGPAVTEPRQSVGEGIAEASIRPPGIVQRGPHEKTRAGSARALRVSN